MSDCWVAFFVIRSVRHLGDFQVISNVNRCCSICFCVSLVLTIVADRIAARLPVWAKSDAAVLAGVGREAPIRGSDDHHDLLRRK